MPFPPTDAAARDTAGRFARSCGAASRRAAAAIISLTAAAAVQAAPVAVQNASFESQSPALGPGGWTNTLSEWSETNEPSSNGFFEYIPGFSADGTDHLGMQAGHDVWQDLGVTYEANARYELTVAVGNRNTSFTQPGNQSTFALAASDGTVYASGLLDASSLSTGSFADAPTLVFETASAPAAVGRQIRVLLQARGPGRSHFDHVRLELESAAPDGTATVNVLPADQVGGATARLRGEVTDVGDGAPAVTFFWGRSDGLTDPAVWEFSASLPGTAGLGGFSHLISGLQSQTDYFFRVRAQNSAGASWSAQTGSFTTLASPPSVENVPAGNLTSTTAVIGAQITNTGGDIPNVTVFYGNADGGLNPGAWQSSVGLGPLDVGSATTAIGGLQAGATYFFRAFATNDGGGSWAPASASFTTPVPTAPSVENRSASGIAGTSATLRGEVTDTGGDPPVVTIFFGASDGAANAGSWQQSAMLGVRSGEFSFFASGLAPETTYYFRSRATNAAGTAWAPASASFTTGNAAAGSVVINEIHYDADPKTLPHEFVELHNPGSEAVDLTGWSLADGIDFAFPNGTSIPAGGYVVVAEDPAALNGAFGMAALGPYSGRLSNDGEEVELRDPAGEAVDRVDYGIGFPWPTAARGAGASMELIHPSLDNDLGGSWRSAQSGYAGPQATYVASGSTWSYRKGTSEASSPRDAWRMTSFAEDGTWLSGPAPIGFGDGDDATVLNDMQTAYSSVFLRRHFSIPAGQVPNRLLVRVYHDDGAIVWINGSEVARVAVDEGEINYMGQNASDPPSGTHGTAVGNHEAAWTDVDVFNAGVFLREGVNTVAVLGLNGGVFSSDFSIDVEVKTPDPSAAATGTPSPGAANSVFSLAAAPQIRQVDHAPKQPASGESVTVTAKVTDPDGVGSVTLHHQSVVPGAYIRKSDPQYDTNWSDVPMRDDGQGGDALASDSIFTAVLPPALQVHRHLVRYRITVTDSLGTSQRVPYEDDEQPNFACFVYDGVPAWTGSLRPGVQPPIGFSEQAMNMAPAYHLISREEDVINCQYNSAFNNHQYIWEGTIVYDGEVYDHIRYRIRGRASTYQVGKNKWKINFNRARSFEARDNHGDKFKAAWDKINVLPMTNPWWRWNQSTDGTIFSEPLSYRFHQLAGVPAPNTVYFQLRVIDDADEAPASDQYGGDFWGLYTAIEQPDSRFLQERDLPDGNIFNMHGSASGSPQRNQGATQPTDRSDLSAFISGYSGTLQPLSWWQANLQLDEYYSFNAANIAVNNADMRPEENINYYHNSGTDRWHVIPWDTDLTFEDGPHYDNWENIDNVFGHASARQDYENRCRELLDLLFDNDDSAHLVDEYAAFLTDGIPAGETIVEANQAQWDYHPRKNKKGIWYANFTPSLLPSRDFPSYVNYTKQFVRSTGYGGSRVAAEATDPAIPATPQIAYAGTPGYPTNGLRFQSSAFSDPQGAATFGAMEWRVAEVHNPTVPNYDPTRPNVYEVEGSWESGELNSFAAEISVPATPIRVARTYRARVRHQDSSGRWSHWSAPIEFTATVPDVTEYQQNLAITEFMYHPPAPSGAELAVSTDQDDFEFIELKNIGSVEIDLTDVRFTKGVDFDFVPGATIAPGGYVLLVSNQAAFEARYGAGLSVVGEFADNRLSNGGEQLKLSFGAGVAIHDFVYSDDSPWPEAADGDGYSLTLVDPASRPDVSLPSSWRLSRQPFGSPGADDAVTFALWGAAWGNPEPTSDGDGDGIDAFLEFVIGGAPDRDDSERLPQLSMVPAVDGSGATVTVPAVTIRRQHAADGVSAVIERSRDLAVWEAADGDFVLVAAVVHGDGTTAETYQMNPDANLASPLYLRVRFAAD